MLCFCWRCGDKGNILDLDKNKKKYFGSACPESFLHICSVSGSNLSLYGTFAFSFFCFRIFVFQREPGGSWGLCSGRCPPAGPKTLLWWSQWHHLCDHHQDISITSSCPSISSPPSIYTDSHSCNAMGLWLAMAAAGRGYYLLVDWLGELPYCGSFNWQFELT